MADTGLASTARAERLCCLQLESRPFGELQDSQRVQFTQTAANAPVRDSRFLAAEMAKVGDFLTDESKALRAKVSRIDGVMHGQVLVEIRSCM
ncbi:hypothetical protein IPC1147_33635 [Pseudomonas aeruginosa]|nr:hypothetical protein IPC1107_33710 [Pseudomonas aeruginosa]RRS17968.1 hypothetical protein IPC1147_33635 [Pseudomonas aeruginosa]